MVLTRRGVPPAFRDSTHYIHHAVSCQHSSRLCIALPINGVHLFVVFLLCSSIILFCLFLRVIVIIIITSSSVGRKGVRCLTTNKRDWSPFKAVFFEVATKLLPSGNNPNKCYGKVLCLQPMIPPKRFDISPPDWGMLRRSRCVQIFL